MSFQHHREKTYTWIINTHTAGMYHKYQWNLVLTLAIYMELSISLLTANPAVSRSASTQGKQQTPASAAYIKQIKPISVVMLIFADIHRHEDIHAAVLVVQATFPSRKNACKYRLKSMTNYS